MDAGCFEPRPKLTPSGSSHCAIASVGHSPSKPSRAAKPAASPSRPSSPESRTSGRDSSKRRPYGPRLMPVRSPLRPPLRQPRSIAASCRAFSLRRCMSRNRRPRSSLRSFLAFAGSRHPSPQPRALHVAAAGPGRCQPRKPLRWPRRWSSKRPRSLLRPWRRQPPSSLACAARTELGARSYSVESGGSGACLRRAGRPARAVGCPFTPRLSPLKRDLSRAALRARSRAAERACAGVLDAAGGRVPGRAEAGTPGGTGGFPRVPLDRCPLRFLLKIFWMFIATLDSMFSAALRMAQGRH